MLGTDFPFPKYQGSVTPEYLNGDPSTGVVILRKTDGSIYALMCLQDYQAFLKCRDEN